MKISKHYDPTYNYYVEKHRYCSKITNTSNIYISLKFAALHQQW